MRVIHLLHVLKSSEAEPENVAIYLQKERFLWWSQRGLCMQLIFVCFYFPWFTHLFIYLEEVIFRHLSFYRLRGAGAVCELVARLTFALKFTHLKHSEHVDSTQQGLCFQRPILLPCTPQVQEINITFKL